MSSAIGGYLAARLRTKWTGLHTNEVFFRDTAHGFIAWAFATVLSASVLAAAATHIVAGAASGAGPAAAQATAPANPSQVFVDRLFRTDAGPTNPSATTAQNGDAVRAEVLRLWTSSYRDNGEIVWDKQIAGKNEFGRQEKFFTAPLVADGKVLVQNGENGRELPLLDPEPDEIEKPAPPRWGRAGRSTSVESSVAANGPAAKANK